MLDVLHYFLEQDLVEADSMQHPTKNAHRSRIYREFYGVTYKYDHQSEDYEETTASGYVGSPTQIDPDFDVSSELNSVRAFNPRENPAKPYVPPTEFDGASAAPFGNLLDAPMK